MKTFKSNRISLTTAAFLLVSLPLAARAAGGIWTNTTSGGLWSNTANWTNGIIPSGGTSGDQAFINQFDWPGSEFVISTDGGAVPALRAVNYNDTGVVPNATLKITGANVLTLWSSDGNDPVYNTGGFVVGSAKIVDLDVPVSGVGDTVVHCVEMNANSDTSQINLLKKWTNVAGLRLTRGVVWLKAGDNTLPTNSLLAFTRTANDSCWLYLNGTSQEAAGLFNLGNYNQHRIYNGNAAGGTLILNVPAGSNYVSQIRIGMSNPSDASTENNISLVKKGDGIQTINKSLNAYDGPTTIEGGVLNIDDQGDTLNGTVGVHSSLGTPASGTTVNTGATLNIQGTGATFSEPLTISGGGFGGVGALRFSGDGAGSGIGITWAGAITLGADATIETSTNTIKATCSGGLTDNGLGYDLTKNGPGELILAPATLNGDCVVNAGTLGLGSSSTLGSLTLASNTVLGVGTQAGVDTLTFSAGTSVLNIDYGDVAGSNPTQAALNDRFSGGNLTLNQNATVTINISGLGFTVTGGSPIPLIDYGIRTGSGTFKLGSLPPGIVGNLGTNGTQLVLNITAAVNDLVWSGTVNGNWDLATLNWNSGAAAYQQSGGIGDIVKFYDGSASTAVNVTTTVTPALMIVNSSSDYSFGGAGKISGVTELRKDGFGAMTVSTANDYTNGTRILDGDVRVGNNAAFGAGTIYLNELEIPQPIRFITLSSDGAAARTLSNPVYIAAANNTPSVATLGDVANNGVLTLAGPVGFQEGITHNVTIESDVVFSGGIVNGGMNKLGAGTWTVTGAPASFDRGFDVRDGALVFNNVTVVTTGEIRADAENASLGYARVVITNGANVTLVDDNVQIGDNSDGIGQNFMDVSATLTLTNGSILMNRNRSTLSEFNLLAGGVVSVQSVGVNGSFNANNSQRFNFNGGTLRAVASSGSFMQGLTEAVIQDGGAVIDSAGYSIDINQVLTGTGGLVKNGAGQLTLQGSNTFAGNVQVNAGDLTLYSAHAGTGSVTCADGTTLGFNSSGSNEVVYLSAATVGSAVGGTLKCRFGGGQTGNPTSPAGYVTNLTLNGTITVEVPNSDGATTASVIPLVGYGTLSGAPNFVVGALADLNDADWAVVNNTSAKQIELVPVPTLSWQPVPGGLELQWSILGTFVQSNAVSVAAPAFWFDMAGTDSLTNLTIIPNPAQTNVFYRLRQ